MGLQKHGGTGAEDTGPDNSYTDLNARIIDQWIEDGWQWGTPISHERYEAALAGDWSMLLTSTREVPRSWFFSDMRGKLAFGPFQMQHEYDVQNGETVHILLPILLAPGEEVRAEDLKIDVQVFDLLNGRKIEFNRLASPTWAWEHETQDFDNHEENLFITYHIPALTQEQIDVYGEVRYYGFTAKLYYKGEPLDCISSPSALILHEQILNSRRSAAPAGGLLPDDGLAPAYEEAEPVSDFTDNFLY